MASFHKSNFGMFGGGFRADMDGYVHTTIRAVMTAPYDTAGERMPRDTAREIAAHNRDAIRGANKELADWQENNS